MKKTLLFLCAAMLISTVVHSSQKLGVYQYKFYGKYPNMLPSFLSGSDDVDAMPFNFPLVETRQMYKDHFYNQYGITANDDTLENHISNWKLVRVDSAWFVANYQVGFIDSATKKLCYFTRYPHAGEKFYLNTETNILEGSDWCGNMTLYSPPEQPEEPHVFSPPLKKDDSLPDVSEMFTNTVTNTNTFNPVFNPVNIVYAPQLGGGGTTTTTTSGGGNGGGRQKVIQNNGGGGQNGGGYYPPPQRNSFLRDAGTTAVGTFVGGFAEDALQRLIWPNNNCYRQPTRGFPYNGNPRYGAPSQGWSPGRKPLRPVIGTGGTGHNHGHIQ